ncbi:uncharacterized protein VP01_784g9 [Puccinia sorghi]|uniref:Uncharacterized protein n=1 Tax=Puccinia sorghi TaxID=27349 RepID=A0A0L6UB34_9BASI|nr:uncharacterized protein VP01_784g9 [Puccinia sorghi]
MVELNNKSLKLLRNSAMLLFESITKNSFSTHAHQTFIKTQEKIKKDHLAKQPFLFFTQDSWTTPNFTAMMTDTVHYIEKDSFMKQFHTFMWP